MGSIDDDSLQPELDEAQRALMQALEEACASDIEKADTGELIRIEEQLDTASKAAKEAVSIRLRQRTQGTKADETSKPGDALRLFDAEGRRWRVFAVIPSAATTERKSLPERYRTGWLAFESAEEMRRVAPIPSGWTRLSIDELRAVWQTAEAAPKRTPSIAAGKLKP